MSIPIGTKPPKQKSKTHLQKKHTLQKKNLHKALTLKQQFFETTDSLNL
jgi:hypothetical protein